MTRPTISFAATVATVGGIGHLPKAPGTWGSLAAALAYVPLYAIGGTGLVAVAALVAFAAGVWAMSTLERSTGRHDPQEAVIDEIAGQWLTLLPAAGAPAAVFVGFLAFRLFDIWKPWPARALDRSGWQGWSGMLDDLAAGAYGFVAVALWQAL